MVILERRDPSGITPFSVLYTDEEIQVEDLADQLGVLPVDLMIYNDLESGELIPADHWVIYPTP